jgi:uncharacterized membrane protein YraQ (UPF0718 family)
LPTSRDRGERASTPDLKAVLKQKAKEAFGPSFLIFLSAALVSGGLAYHLKGGAVLAAAAATGADQLLSILPKICAALLIAGCVSVLLPREWMARWIGGRSGFVGLLLAELVGLFTPGGPATAFSLVAALKAAGADRGVLIAYAGGWALLGVQRVLIWELPLLGPDFAITRYLISLPLPILAALLARQLRFRLEPEAPAHD